MNGLYSPTPEAGISTSYWLHDEDRTFRPFAEAKFTQPRTNEDMQVEFTVRVQCEGDPDTGKVDGPIDLFVEINEWKDEYYQRPFDRQVNFKHRDSTTYYKSLSNFATGRNGFVLTTEYRDEFWDKNYIEDKSSVLIMLRNVMDNSILEIEVMEVGTKLKGKMVVRHFTVGANLYSAMSQCFVGQKREEDDNPHFVEEQKFSIVEG